MTSSRMFDTVCTLPLTSDLFAQAVHPIEPLVAVGLLSGHVEMFRLPPLGGSDNGSDTPLLTKAPIHTNGTSKQKSLLRRSSGSEAGVDLVGTQWRTRRHKSSCRTLCFSQDGLELYSAGGEGIVKAASSMTGQVESKILLPPHKSKTDAPVLVNSLTPQTLLVATDSGALHIYDLRSSSRTFDKTRPSSTYNPHDDYISSLTPLPSEHHSTTSSSKSGTPYPNRFITTGGTTLAVTDIRKGVQSRSADQETELLSSAFVAGFSSRGTNVGSKIVAGDASGVLTLWERGVWDDQDERIVMSRMLQRSNHLQLNAQTAEVEAESVDCLVKVPKEVAGNEKVVAAGLSGGLVALVQLGSGHHEIVDVFRHHDAEGAEHVGFDVFGRVITGGGLCVKVWREKSSVSEEGDDEDSSEEEEVVNGEDTNEKVDDSSESDHERPRKKRKGNGNPKMGSFKGLD